MAGSHAGVWRSTLMLTSLVLALACCDQRPAVTFDELTREVDVAAARLRAARATLSAVGTDLRFGAGGRWVLVAVPPAGFSPPLAIDQGLSVEEAHAIAAASPTARSARFVYLTAEGVSVAELATDQIDVPLQRVVTGSGISWLSFTLELRGDGAPQLSGMRSSQTPP